MMCYLMQQLTQQELKYDEARSPMQWSASENAGFTSAQNPWCPIGSNYLTANVQVRAVVSLQMLLLKLVY